MKTKLFKTALLLSITFLLGLSSCTKEETVTDPRDQIVGTYTGKQIVSVSYSDFPVLDMTDVLETYNVTVKIEKSTTVKEEIIITEIDADGNTTYKANAVTLASNGSTFNIPSQLVPFDETTNCTINGYTNVTLGSSKYDGVYFSDDKKISYGFKGNVYTDGYPVPFMFNYLLYKQ